MISRSCSGSSDSGGDTIATRSFVVVVAEAAEMLINGID